MPALQIHMFPCLSDNYGYLVHDPDSGETACIDTPEADRILAEARFMGWRITQIWNTHWHPDHAGGNERIKKETGCTIFGPKVEAAKIPALDQAIGEGDELMLGSHVARVLDVGGHTLGHIAFHLPADKLAFVGDALFALGCGRVFEGTFGQMWDSLSKLAALPKDTVVYCAHEYTQSNARFAVTIEPQNAALLARVEEINSLRARNEPTVPTTIGLELKTNPFLRAAEADVRANIQLPNASAAEAFAEIRRRKDAF